MSCFRESIDLATTAGDLSVAKESLRKAAFLALKIGEKDTACCCLKRLLALPIEDGEDPARRELWLTVLDNLKGVCHNP